MEFPSLIEDSTRLLSSLLGPLFAWRSITGGRVVLEDATEINGTRGGEYGVADFWMAQYPVTNAQYQVFLDAPDGFGNPQWWAFSPQACQWHLDHGHPKPTAFRGDFLPRTRVSWFDSLAFCGWLSARCGQGLIRLPTEQEWQRAAVGDSGWAYPWGNELDPSRANYASHNGQPTPVDRYPDGKSPYGVLDMTGNVWEWCLTAWGKEEPDLSGYTYRAMQGGAWNIIKPEHLRPVSRNSHPPRGQLNDAGFRLVYADFV